MSKMRETKIRFGRRAWELIQEEADLDGTSASQFVREAALGRALFLRYRRGAGEEEIGKFYDQVFGRLRTEE